MRPAYFSDPLFRRVSVLPIIDGMDEQDQDALRGGDRHLACTVSSVLIRRVRRLRGEDGLMEMLERAGSTRTIAYLDDVSNWISFDEAMALLE